jgi:hypothetical protein
MARILSAVTMLMLLVTLLSCREARPYLAPHPISEMFPRASSPPPSCPGQYRSMVQDSGVTYFMGCWGQKQDEMR